MTAVPTPKKTKLFRNLFTGLAIMVLIYALIVGALGEIPQMSIAAFLSITLFLFSMKDEFSLLKAGAFEARMKEVVEETEDQLQEVVKEAEDHLKKLFVVMAELVLSIIIRQGRLGAGYNEKEKQAYRNEIMGLLKAIGLSSYEQEKVLKDFHRFTLFDLYRACITTGHKARKDIPVDHLQEWEDKISKRDIDDLPSAEELEIFFKKTGLWDQETQNCVEDYRFYFEKNQRVNGGDTASRKTGS